MAELVQLTKNETLHGVAAELAPYANMFQNEVFSLVFDNFGSGFLSWFLLHFGPTYNQEKCDHRQHFERKPGKC